LLALDDLLDAVSVYMFCVTRFEWRYDGLAFALQIDAVVIAGITISRIDAMFDRRDSVCLCCFCCFVLAVLETICAIMWIGCCLWNTNQTKVTNLCMVFFYLLLVHSLVALLVLVFVLAIFCIVVAVVSVVIVLRLIDSLLSRGCYRFSMLY
jgi:hypothetical protein